MDGLATPAAGAGEAGLTGPASTRAGADDIAPAASGSGTAPAACGTATASRRGAGRPHVFPPAGLAGAAFSKMSGGGNDFVVFDNRDLRFRMEADAVAALCARGLGIGADAVLLLEPPASAGADFRMVYYNADGSEAPMCGNGALCIARFARDIGAAHGREPADGGPIEVFFDTGAGRYRAELFPDAPSRVRLSMRDPTAVEPSLPEIEERGYARAGFADTGTPHLVVLASDLQELDVTEQGAALRRHPPFQPEGLNVDFVEVLGRGELAIRTYERGVEAETLSCGTGAAAAAILTHLWGMTEAPILVRPRGGFDLRIGFERTTGGELGRVTLEGDARVVFTGALPWPEGD